MKYKKACLMLTVMAAAMLAAGPSPGADPDLRNIPPNVMLLLDTSGSMDYLRVTHSVPDCKSDPTKDDLTKETRWMTVLDALFGPVSDESFQCYTIYPGETLTYYETGVDKLFSMTVPDDYIKSHWVAMGGRDNTFGILERYRAFVRFGLATMDSFENAGTGEDGMWSYGPVVNGRNAGIKRAEPISGGVQQDIIPGALISWGPDTESMDLVNYKIRWELAQTIPYCGTPIASALDDVEVFLSGEPNNANFDRYFSCRERMVILVTDATKPKSARMNEEAWFGSLPPQEAASLWGMSPKAPLYVLWYPSCPKDSVAGSEYSVNKDYINEIAFAGCPPSNTLCPPDGAYVFENRDEISAYLDKILKRAMVHAISRTVPITTNQVGDKGKEDGIVQYQFNTYFSIPPDGGPWQGVVERYNYTCDSADLVVLDTTTYLDYGAKLDAKAGRKIYTSVDPLARASGEQLGVGDAFDTSNLTSEILGEPSKDAAWVESVVNFVQGTGGSARDPSAGGHRLADPFHASAAILSPPVNDLPFLSYMQYQIDHSTRIPVLFVATNEGIVHAFRTQDTSDANQTGEELWAYVPGSLLPKISKQIPDTHLWGLDSSPVVGDIRTFKGPTYDATLEKWKAILVGGMRQGGYGYYALEVTEPESPKFLWEITPDKPGFINSADRPFAGLKETYAQPLLGTVFTQHPDPDIDILGEIAAVIFPGGFNPASRNASTSLYVVTAEKGILIKELSPQFPDELSCAAPPDCTRMPECCAQLIGSPVGFSSMPGYLTSRVFIGDDRGRVWRADLSSRNPDNWKLTLFYPVAQGTDSAPYTVGQPVESPVGLAMDDKGHLVVVFGTGILDDLTGMTQNYVFSLTEEVGFDSALNAYVGKPVFNWAITLEEGEKLTGQPNIFNEVAYFSTFIPYTNAADLCQIGQGRIWGVNYNKKPDPMSDAGFAKMDVDGTPDGEGTVLTHMDFDNVLISGLTVVQRPSCLEIDPLDGLTLSRSSPEVYEIVAQKSGMGIQPGQPETQCVRIKIPSPQLRNLAESWGLLIE